MSNRNRFTLTDEEVEVLAFVLWAEDNSLAMMPPGQFTEQAKHVRVVSNLQAVFEKRAKEVAERREKELREALFGALDAALLPTDVLTEQVPDLDVLLNAVIKIVREHDNPIPPAAPLDSFPVVTEDPFEGPW